jgi:unsaturated rhamnogalacturonyl hydrolase
MYCADTWYWQFIPLFKAIFIPLLQSNKRNFNFGKLRTLMPNDKPMRIALLIFAIVLITGCTIGKQKNGDEDRQVKWSVRMADVAMEHCDSLMNWNEGGKRKWQYDVALLGQAIDKLGYLDTVYSKYYEDYINYFVRDDSIISYNISDYNLDNVNPSKGLITLYKRTGQVKYLNAINIVVKQLEHQPKTHSGGYWHKARYPWQMWLDGTYMSAPFLAQYANEFNKPEWFDTVAFQLIHIYGKTLDPGSGLLYHAWDESGTQAWCNPETGQSREFWGRGMGWYMMALVDVLGYLPVDHPRRDSIISIFEKTSEALLKVRDPETGLWYQVLDKGGEEGNYLEASCSAMFTYAFAKGTKMGYLPVKYQDIAMQTFQSMVKVFISTDKDGNPALKNICGAAGLGGKPYRDGSYSYYIHEKRVDNDTKGVGPFIMAAIELNM